jgi:glycosyltransferase involved in cell wall biosynthesis
MRILITLESLVFGGAQITTMRLVKELMREHDVSIFVLNPPSKTNGIPVPENVAVYSKEIHPSILSLFDKIDKLTAYIGFSGISATAYLYQNFLKKIVDKNKIDLVYSNAFNADYLIAKTSMKHTKKIVACHCEYKPSYLKNSRYRKFMAKQTLSDIDGFIYFTKESFEAFKYLHINNPKLIHSKLGQFLSDEEIQSKTIGKPLSRKDFGIEDSDFVFIAISRAEKEKGWEETIQAFNQVNSQHSNTHLLLVGGESLHNPGYIDSLKKKYPNPNIHYTGFTQNTFPYIKMADVGLLLSYKEVYPLVVIEYLSLNKPVIATEVGEIKEMISESDLLAGVTVPLLPNGFPDTENLSKKMLEMVENPENFERIINNTTLLKEKFNAQQSIRQYIQVFEKVLKAKAYF